MSNEILKLLMLILKSSDNLECKSKLINKAVRKEDERFNDRYTVAKAIEIYKIKKNCFNYDKLF